MRSIAVSEATRSFMAILKAAEDGEEVVITRAGKPVAKLVGMNRDRAAPGESTKPEDSAKSKLRSLGWRDHP